MRSVLIRLITLALCVVHCGVAFAGRTIADDKFRQLEETLLPMRPDVHPEHRALAIGSKELTTRFEQRWTMSTNDSAEK